MNTTLRPGIDWVGYIDWTVRDFHSYVTARGATYNAYLVRDEKTALIDTVKHFYADTLLRHISAIAPPESIDYIVVNHGEPDHSSSLPSVMGACPNAEIVCTAKVRQTLEEHYDTGGWRFREVADGDTLSLGRRTLQFAATPMVHWPDSTATYVPEEKLLFSMDAFGQHYASANRFDDEVPLGEVMEEAKTYYANIVMPYGRQVQRAMKALGGLDIEMIAPGHGVIWRSHVAEILEAYRDWMVCRARPKVVVLFDSMWGSTETMAKAIVEGAAEVEGVTVKLFHVRRTEATFIVPEVMDTAVLAAGSSTLNQTLMPAAAATLTYLQGLRPTGKAGLAFGAYGWGSTGGAEAVQDYLEATKVEILRPPLKGKYTPTDEVLAECREAGRMLAEKALEIAAEPVPAS
jgi:flavorubredoxin